jgi:hypothetical protein
MNIVNVGDEDNELDAAAKAALSSASKLRTETKGEFKMIPFTLDYVVERIREGECEEQRALRELAGVRLRPDQARTEWRRVLEHKWFVSERLGRDIGLRVAAIDYFENVRLPRQVRTGRAAGLSLPRRATQPHGLTA